MKTVVEELEATKVKLSVEVAYEELSDEMDRVYRELSQQVNIPGFRRGHVPRQVLDRRIGRGYVIQQAVDTKLSDFYRQALEEKDVRPLAAPKIEITELPAVEGKPGGELKFEAEVEVEPEFDLPTLEGLSVEVETEEVSDNDVEKELDQLRQRFASLKPVDRPIEDGDFITIDMNAQVDGKEADSVSGVSYEVGSASMLPAMDQNLVGLSAGESVTFEDTLQGGDYSGQKGEVTVKVESVKVRELPEADDDFAQEVSEFDSIGELRADIRSNLERRQESALARKATEKVSDYLIEKSDFPLPSGVVEEQVAAAAGADQDQAEEADAEAKDDQDKDKDADRRKAVERALRRELVLSRLARENDVKVEPSEVYQQIWQFCQAVGLDPMQVIQNQEEMARIHAEMLLNKALMVATRKVEIKDESGKVLDLSEQFKTFEEQQSEAQEQDEAEGEQSEAQEQD